MRSAIFLLPLTLLFFFHIPSPLRAQTETEEKAYSRGKAIAFSAVVPGLGITKLRNGGPYWLIGVADYSCLVSGITLNIIATSTYVKYKNATTASDRDKYYSRAKSQNLTGNILLYTAAGIWVADMIITAFIPAKIQAGISLGPAYDPVTKRPMVALRYRFGK